MRVRSIQRVASKSSSVSILKVVSRVMATAAASWSKPNTSCCVSSPLVHLQRGAPGKTCAHRCNLILSCFLIVKRFHSSRVQRQQSPCLLLDSELHAGFPHKHKSRQDTTENEEAHGTVRSAPVHEGFGRHCCLLCSALWARVRMQGVLGAHLRVSVVTLIRRWPSGCR